MDVVDVGSELADDPSRGGGIALQGVDGEREP